MGLNFKKILGGVTALANPLGLISTAGAIGGDLIGGFMAQDEGAKARNQQDRINQMNYDMQKEFAQNSLRWKVQDAIAAGIHPLAAMGAQGYSASPSAIATGPDNSMSNMVRGMGQNISRAVQATQTQSERVATRLAEERMMLENEGQALQNQILRKQLNPALPSSNVVETPLTRVAAEKERNWQEVGSYPSVAYMQSPTGLVPVMPPNLAEALESDQSNQLQWALRYKGGPNVAPSERPANAKLPRWASGWDWSFKYQEWQPKTEKYFQEKGRRMAEERLRPRFRSAPGYERFYP